MRIAKFTIVGLTSLRTYFFDLLYIDVENLEKIEPLMKSSFNMLSKMIKTLNQ